MKKFICLMVVFALSFFMFFDSISAEVVEDENEDSIVVENEIHKVRVVVNKVDELNNPLSGAVLQIIDSNGNVVSEWTSNGSSYEILLPEGDYTLHEKEAPDGYIKSDDKTFTIKVEELDLEAGVDYSKTPCEHYEGTPLYYVEMKGEKSEVYCINQDWETPDDNSSYDGSVLVADDIRNYTQQTVYVDAHQNTGKKDVSEQSLSSQELYDKILDIIYHRQNATTVFSDLTEAEIRYVTESALKNYTNAGLTRVQRDLKSNAPVNYESYDYYFQGRYVWYLYPWYRSFVYDPNQPLGSDIFKTVIGEGDAFGTLARHWNDGHDAKNSEEVRNKLARYYELYQYLINDSEKHPSDMHLYIYVTDNKASKKSRYNFDEGAYQNLLGVRWFNPNDEDYQVELNVVNTKEDVEEYGTGDVEYEILPPVTGISSDNTNTYYSLVVLVSLLGFNLSVKRRFN